MGRFWLVTHRWITMPVMIIVGLTGAVLVWYSSAGLARWQVELGLGRAGDWIVNIVTIAGSFLVIGGVHPLVAPEDLRRQTLQGVVATSLGAPPRGRSESG
ncbi:MAG: hypothetical protein ACKVZ0_16530 [Gemmatimonadales bacterium]